MNYLAHAFLSFGDAEILTGNMIGDHVKGTAALEQYPDGIKKGIILHRKIDSYMDESPATARAKVWFRQTYGLYAGAIVDTLFDHYMATDPHYFKTEKELLSFSQDVYKKLAQHKTHFPPHFAAMFPYMEQENWLYKYRTMTGVKRALQGLQHRAKYMPDAEDAYNTFIVSYYEIGQCYYEFIEKVYKFVKTELSQT